MVQIHVRVRILRPPVTFDPSGHFELGCWAKSHGTHNAPFFPAREISHPRLEKYRVLDLLVVGNGGPLMLRVPTCTFSGGFLFLGTHLIRLLRFLTGL